MLIQTNKSYNKISRVALLVEGRGGAITILRYTIILELDTCTCDVLMYLIERRGEGPGTGYRVQGTGYRVQGTRTGSPFVSLLGLYLALCVLFIILVFIVRL